MIIYLFIITAVCVYDIVQIIHKGKKVELFILLFFATLSFWLSYMYLFNPHHVSISDFVLSLIKIDYIKGQ